MKTAIVLPVPITRFLSIEILEFQRRFCFLDASRAGYNWDGESIAFQQFPLEFLFVVLQWFNLIAENIFSWTFAVEIGHY
ncbi:MAG: hypothetical protein OXE85_04035, partial [Roseovarius sp.]|nr:hypothetical protein [Roseovarius sp.]